MSRSLARVRRALQDAGLPDTIRLTTNQTRTAAQAAAELGCAVDQIAKSIIFRGGDSDRATLFITAGGRSVDPAKAEAAAGESLGRADADFVRSRTGFAIGGVAPIGHLDPPRAFFDPRLLAFEVVFAAAGTPRHLFGIAPRVLQGLADAEPADFV